MIRMMPPFDLSSANEKCLVTQLCQMCIVVLPVFRRLHIFFWCGLLLVILCFCLISTAVNVAIQFFEHKIYYKIFYFTDMLANKLYLAVDCWD